MRKIYGQIKEHTSVSDLLLLLLRLNYNRRLRIDFFFCFLGLDYKPIPVSYNSTIYLAYSFQYKFIFTVSGYISENSFGNIALFLVFSSVFFINFIVYHSS